MQSNGKHRDTQAENLRDENGRYARTVLDSLSAHVAIIDAQGTILETNRAWKRFARSNRIGMRPDTLQVNYLEICDSARGDSADRSADVADGIRQVINGSLDEFLIDYPCHSPEEQRWFYMRATRAVGPGPLRVVISHENITALKLAESRLRESEAELRRKTAHLEEANAALRALLRQRSEDAQEMEQIVLENIRTAVLPHVEKLDKMLAKPASRRLVDLIRSGLNDITTPFLRRLATLEMVLTPQEIRIAAFIREGCSSKDISGMLGLSVATINFHRRNLREKLGLTNSAANLRTFLMSLT